MNVVSYILALNYVVHLGKIRLQIIQKILYSLDLESKAQKS